MNTLEDQAELLSNTYKEKFSRLYDFLIYNRYRQIKKNPFQYLRNPEAIKQTAFDVTNRYIKFQKYKEMKK
jgi:uncharacterized protein (UPF0305 family)